jgi:hypothetical protein
MLRTANGVLITATEIAKAAMGDKGMSAGDPVQVAALTEMVLLSLGRLRRRGVLSKRAPAGTPDGRLSLRPKGQGEQKSLALKSLIGEQISVLMWSFT